MEKRIIPTTIQQTAEAISLAAKQNRSILIWNDSASPLWDSHSLLLDLTQLHRIGPVMGNATSGYVIQVEAGTSYPALAAVLAAQNLAFAPALAEPCTLGGMFCGRSGFAMKNRVLGITLIQSDGTPFTLSRGQCYFDRTGCTLPDGRRLELGFLPDSSDIPCLPACGSDLLDLFAGSCNTLGIVALLVLQLHPETTAQALQPTAREIEAQSLSETHRNIITRVRQFFDPHHLLLQNAPASDCRDTHPF